MTRSRTSSARSVTTISRLLVVKLSNLDRRYAYVVRLLRYSALFFGRVTYEMMEAAFRPRAQTGRGLIGWNPFGRTIDAAKKYVVSSTLDRVDWNGDLGRGDLGNAVQQLKAGVG